MQAHPPPLTRRKLHTLVERSQGGGVQFNSGSQPLQCEHGGPEVGGVEGGGSKDFFEVGGIFRLPHCIPSILDTHKFGA